MLQTTIQRASAAALLALLPHYLLFAMAGTPLWTERIAEWIMSETPNTWAIWMLDRMGPWAKPFAMTGGLATLGGALWAVALGLTLTHVQSRRKALQLATGATALVSLSLAWLFEYHSIAGHLSFWLPAAIAVAVLSTPRRAAEIDNSTEAVPTRRQALQTAGKLVLPTVMSGGVVAVAAESYWRDERLARFASTTTPLYPFQPPRDREGFAAGLAREAVTPLEPKDKFYWMSKAAVDPAIEAQEWSLAITANGKLLRRITYRELLSLPRTERYVTLRCVSNSLTSDLMDTASFLGVTLSQLVDRKQVPNDIVEVAVLGADGHSDSLRPEYAFSDEVLFAFGMNGKTLHRRHGYPLRMLTPRYYGFRSIKWINEIAFVSQPHFGTWAKKGFTKEPLIQTASHIDGWRATSQGLLVAGASFAGTRGIQRVLLRTTDSPWVEAQLEQPLSPYTLTRWVGTLPGVQKGIVEARSQDGTGKWQEQQEGPLYPTGVVGPTRKRIGV